MEAGRGQKNYLKDFSKKVELSGKIRGNNPLSLISAVFVFFAAKIGISKIDVSRVAKNLNVAANTVVKAVAHLEKHKALFLTEDFVKKIKKCSKKRKIT